MFFKSSEHMEQFLDTMEEIKKVRDGVLDLEYAAAVYILTADKEIWSKAKEYIDREGIDIPTMLEERDFSSGYATLVKLAGNLFNNHEHLDPLDLMWLDEDNFKTALTALQLRRYRMHIDDISLSGRPVHPEKEQIIELRKSGWTQEAIAKELNVSLSTVRRHTRGI